MFARIRAALAAFIARARAKVRASFLVAKARSAQFVADHPRVTHAAAGAAAFAAGAALARACA